LDEHVTWIKSNAINSNHSHRPAQGKDLADEDCCQLCSLPQPREEAEMHLSVGRDTDNYSRDHRTRRGINPTFVTGKGILGSSEAGAGSQGLQQAKASWHPPALP